LRCGRSSYETDQSVCERAFNRDANHIYRIGAGEGDAINRVGKLDLNRVIASAPETVSSPVDAWCSRIGCGASEGGVGCESSRITNDGIRTIEDTHNTGLRLRIGVCLGHLPS